MKQKKFYERDKDIENTFLFFSFLFFANILFKNSGKGKQKQARSPTFYKGDKGFWVFLSNGSQKKMEKNNE